jgi:hypothetical protein
MEEGERSGAFSKEIKKGGRTEDANLVVYFFIAGLKGLFGSFSRFSFP